MKRLSLHFFALYAYLATVAPYLQKFLAALGFDEGEIGLLQGLMGGAGVAGMLGLGQLADVLGQRRLTLVAAAAISTIGFVPLIWADTMLLAVPLMLLIGVFFRTTMPLADAIASAELPDPDRQYGPARLWGTVGFIVTLLTIRLFGWVDEGSAISILRAILVCGGLCAASAVLLPDNHRRRDKDNPPAEGDGFAPLFWAGIAIVSTGWFAMSSHGSFFTLFLEARFGMASGAWAWSLGAIAELPVLLLGGALVRKLRLGPMILIALLGSTVRFGLYAVAPHVAVVLAAQVLHALSFGALHIAAMSLIRRTTARHRRSLAMSVYMAAAAGAPLMFGSSIGGALVEARGYAFMYGVYACIPLIGAAILALAWRPIRRLEDDEGEPAPPGA